MLFWKQVSGQDVPSRFISRLVTRRKEKQHKYREPDGLGGGKKSTKEMGTETFMLELMCNISV